MTNANARNELRSNLRTATKMWRYAQARGLSFAKFYADKVRACLDALYMRLTDALLITLSGPAPFAVWS